MNHRPLTAWPVRRGMLLCGCLALWATVVALRLPVWAGIAIAAACVVGGGLCPLLPAARRTVPLFCCVFLLLFLVPGLYRRVERVQPLQALVGQTDTVCGRVIDCPRSGKLYTVQITGAQRLPVGSRILLYCPDIAGPAQDEKVTAAVELYALQDTQIYRQADGVFLLAYPTGYGENAVQVTAASGSRPWRSRLRPLRERLVGRLRQILPGDEGVLLAAMCLGDRSRLPSEMTEAFRACGLSHLLAISGLHLSMIAAGVLLCLRILRLRPPIAAAVTMLATGGFAWLVEWTPSVSRACVMIVVMLCGRLFRRRADGLNSLGFALAVLLAIEPYALYDVGMWLSFGATGGVLCLTPRLQALLTPAWAARPTMPARLMRRVVNNLAVSLGATLPLLPLLSWVYGEISLLTPLFNLIAVLPAGCLLLLGCAGIALSALPFVGFLGRLWLLPAGWLAKALLWLTSLPARVGVGAVPVCTMWALWWITAGSVWVMVCIAVARRRRVIQAAAFCLVLLLVGHTVNAREAATVTRVHLLAGKGTVLVVDQPTSCAVLAARATDLRQVGYWLEEQGLPAPQTIVVGDGDTTRAAYVAALAGENTRCVLCGGDEWVSGVSLNATVPVAGQTLSLCEDSAFTPGADGWWALDIRGSRLLMAPDGVRTPPETYGTADGLVFCEQMRYNDNRTVNKLSVWLRPAGKSVATPARSVPANTICRLVNRSGRDWSVAFW